MKFKAVNIYMECFSLLEDRSSNPFSRLWDTVNYELSSTLYCLALKKKSALCRVSIRLLGLGIT